MSLGKLKKYADAYNIRIDRAVEKDDVIDCILAARVSIFLSSSTLGSKVNSWMVDFKRLSCKRQ